MSAPAQIAVRFTRSKSIEDHVSKIIEVKQKSMRDPEVRQLAVKIVSSSYVWAMNPRTGKQEPFIKAWGKSFRVPVGQPCPARDDECEIRKVWNFVVTNFRYVYDPLATDTFATTRYSLDAGGGDCDDATIVFGSLLEAIGFHVRARVISTPDAPSNWVHIYPLVGVSKDDPQEWVPLDMTVKGYRPGDQWPDIAKFKDFDM